LGGSHLWASPAAGLIPCRTSKAMATGDGLVVGSLWI
jgi:hypothetical protein